MYKSKCFGNRNIPHGVDDICKLHLEEYEMILSREKRNKLEQKDNAEKVKSLLYSYYAQKSISAKKWEYSVKVMKASNDTRFKISDALYRKVTKASKRAYNHYCKYLKMKEYKPYLDANIDNLMSIYHYNYQDSISTKEITSKKFLECFKTALSLQFINAHKWNKRDSLSRSNCIVDALSIKTKSIIYKNNIEHLYINGNEYICFTTYKSLKSSFQTKKSLKK